MKKLFLLIISMFIISIYAQDNIINGSVLKNSETYFISMLNTYRLKHNLNSLEQTDRLWQWSYDQSYYEANLHKLHLQNGFFNYIGGHTQDIDIPDWEEQDRTSIPLEIRPLVRENVAVFWEKEIYPNKPFWNNEKEIAKEFLDAWIASKGHNETLLDPDSEVISICFYKTEIFIAKQNGKKYNVVIIAATLNMGVF